MYIYFAKFTGKNVLAFLRFTSCTELVKGVGKRNNTGSISQVSHLCFPHAPQRHEASAGVLWNKKGLHVVARELHFEVFQKHLYRYLLDYTKEKARIDGRSNKEDGAFESYRAILHRGLNISDERRFDVVARVLNPRRKNDSDIHSALQEWRHDQA